MSGSAIEAIIGLVVWVVYGLVIIRLVRRWLFERRISKTQAAFLFASWWSLWFLYGAIIVAIESRGMTGAVLFILLIGTLLILFGTWGLRWLMPDLHGAIIQDELRKRGQDRVDDRRE